MIKRWFRNWLIIARDIIGGITLYWLFIELSSYSTNGQIDTLAKNPSIYFFVFLLIIGVSLFKNRPKMHFTSRIRSKDLFIELKVGDAFKNEGALIVPINDRFDMTLGGNVKKAKSVQNRLVQDYYDGKPEHVETDILSKGIEIGTKYAVGTTLEIENKEKRFYLVVNSVKNMSNDRVRASIDDLMLALNGAWEYIANESSRNKTLTIPLINTGHGRDPSLTKMATAKEIIASYVEASKRISICERLVISVTDGDIENGLINIDELAAYLESMTAHYRQVTFSPVIDGGSSVGPQVINIES